LKRFLCSTKVSLDKVGVTRILIYLAHLHDLGYVSRSISLHRSTISVTIPFINRVATGSNPLISRLCKGAFKKRPPPRKMPKVWDPNPVLDIYMHWTLSLSCAQIVRKCAFIITIFSGRRLSELFNLKCDSNHLQLLDNFVQLVPAFLSKTDKASKIGHPICLRSYREDESLCPVAIIRALLEERDALDVRHDHLFFNPSRPNSLVTLDIFKGFITRSLRDTGIDASPGYTRATAASSTLGRGASIGDILWMGNWSASSTFLSY
jgi:hypothetical protein